MNEAAAQVRSRLAALGRVEDCDLDLAETALLLAALARAEVGTPLDITPHVGVLQTLGAELARRLAGCDNAEHAAAALFEVMTGRHGFRPDERDDESLGGFDLPEVIDRRRGGSEALGVLAVDVARRAGLQADGLAFPVHFLVRIGLPGGGRAIFDPFGHGGALGAADLRAMLKAVAGLEAELEPGHYAPMDNRDLLLRLGNGAKLRLLRHGHVARALGLVEALLLVAPDTAMLWREAGLMHMRLDNTRRAVAALEQFVSRSGNAQAKARTLALLAELRRRLT